jgi:acetolactate synthase-1/2/3 large subunit
VNNGYASIRMTQSNYFGGRYIGCDAGTGLGSPDWAALAGAFGIDSYELDEHFTGSARFQELWRSPSPILFLVPVDPEQTYYPKISSRVLENGMMESAPLDQMSPDASDTVREAVEAFRASW